MCLSFSSVEISSTPWVRPSSVWKVIGPNRQRLAAQQVAHVRQQQLVLENATGEDDVINLRLL